MRLSLSARRQILATGTGLIVFTTFYVGQKPWEQLGWFYYGVAAYMSGFLIQLCSIAVLAGYCTIRKHVLPSDDALSPSRLEMDAEEVFIVFCVSLLVVCAVLYLGKIGAFENMSASEELTLR